MLYSLLVFKILKCFILYINYIIITKEVVTVQKKWQFLEMFVCIKFKVPQYLNVEAIELIPPNINIENRTNLTKIGHKIRDHVKFSLREN